jgi:hypothetical protein
VNRTIPTARNNDAFLVDQHGAKRMFGIISRQPNGALHVTLVVTLDQWVSRRCGVRVQERHGYD